MGQIEICAVPMTDAIATGEVNCYNCIVRCRSIRRFTETISQGYYSAAQPHLSCEDMGMWTVASQHLGNKKLGEGGARTNEGNKNCKFGERTYDDSKGCT